jgi:hypothetical protein
MLRSIKTPTLGEALETLLNSTSETIAENAMAVYASFGEEYKAKGKVDPVPTPAQLEMFSRIFEREDLAGNAQIILSTFDLLAKDPQAGSGGGHIFFDLYDVYWPRIEERLRQVLAGHGIGKHDAAKEYAGALLKTIGQSPEEARRVAETPPPDEGAEPPPPDEGAEPPPPDEGAEPPPPDESAEPPQPSQAPPPDEGDYIKKTTALAAISDGIDRNVGRDGASEINRCLKDISAGAPYQRLEALFQGIEALSEVMTNPYLWGYGATAVGTGQVLAEQVLAKHGSPAGLIADPRWMRFITRLEGIARGNVWGGAEGAGQEAMKILGTLTESGAANFNLPVGSEVAHVKDPSPPPPTGIPRTKRPIGTIRVG